MYRWFFEGNHLLGFALFALFLFLGFFAASVVRAMTRPRQQIDEMAAMPLFDDQQAPSSARTEASHV